MSVITKNYKVEYIISNTVFTDITDFVYSLDDFVLQSTGKIATAKFTLNSEFGNFITDANGGVTPIINQFDRIRVTAIGDDGVTLKSHIFEVTTDLSQNALGSSYLLPIELEGRERNLSGVPFGGFFRTDTHKGITDRIRGAYNNQIKTLQPVMLSSSANDIPDFNPNIWDFTQVDNCFDAFLVVLDQLNLPVSGGGGGNRYAIIFEDKYNTFPSDIDLDFMEVKIIIQGSNNVSPVLLAQNDDHPITFIDRIKQPSTGTVTIARGRPKTSQQPQNYPLFTSRLEFYRNIKQYDNTLDYPTDSYVSLGANVGGWPQRYQANTDTTAGDAPPSASWNAIDVGDFIGILQYSPWTIDKAVPIQNGFANPDGPFSPTTTGAISVPDHNLSINDVRGDFPFRIGTFRDFVTFRTNSNLEADIPTAKKNYLLDILGNGTTFGWYDGFKVLVDPNIGTLAGVFAGSDSNGVSFSGNMAIFRASPGIPVLAAGSSTAGEWFVVRVAQDFDQCAVYDEAIIYEWNVLFPTGQANYVYPGQDRRRGGAPATFEWRSIADEFLGNECFHQPISISNVTGLVATLLPDGEPLNDPNGDPYNEGTLGNGSAIQIIYGYNQVNETQEEHDVWFGIIKRVISTAAKITALVVGLAANVFTTFTTPQYTNMGWWFVWPSPYPFSTFNAIAEEVGEIYGGNFATLNDHRYFDMFNIQYTTTGLEGWTQTDSSDLSEVTGVEFLFNYDITIAGNRIPFTGDIPFLYWCIDKFGTVWKSSKIMYRHLGETQQIKIEFGDLSPAIRGRTPLGIDNILENIIVAEVEVNEVFFKDTVIIQGFQCETPYDEFGRYAPNLWEQVIKPTFFDIFSGGSSDVRFIGIIDAYGFTKTPVAISAPTTLSANRTIIPQFKDYQNIVNVEQLQRFANAQNQIEEFPYEQYTVKQGGINDLDLEDSVILFDPYMIKESDSGPNTRLLAIREIHYSAPHNSGLVRKVVATKVIDT